MKFMALFDANGNSAPSLFPEKAKTYISGMTVTTENDSNNLNNNNDKNSNLIQRTEDALRKAFLRKRMALKAEFEKLDKLNTGRLSLDWLFEILEAVNAKPLPNRSELRILWKSASKRGLFFKRSDETVSFAELERWAEVADGGKMGRHILPRIPVLGDDDVMLSSKTLSNDLHLLETQLNMATQQNIDWVRVQLLVWGIFWRICDILKNTLEFPIKPPPPHENSTPSAPASSPATNSSPSSPNSVPPSTNKTLPKSPKN